MRRPANRDGLKSENSVTLLLIHESGSLPREDSTFPAHDAGALVRCTECRRQLPMERAVKSETDRDLRYFCGLKCLNPWQQRLHARRRKR